MPGCRSPASSDALRSQDFRHFFAIGIGRGRYRQHHARDRVRERPVDKLLGNKRLVRHDYLFTVPVADGGGAGVNFRHATGKIADRYRIANANRFFEQDNQARDKVGENLLQTKTEDQTPSAATSHCNFDHSIPIIEKPTSPPISISRYLVMVVMA